MDLVPFPLPQQELLNSFLKSEQNQSKQPEIKFNFCFLLQPQAVPGTGLGPCWVASLRTDSLF